MPDDPITKDDQIDLCLLVEAAQTVADLEVGELAIWLLKAHCTRHGDIQKRIDTLGGMPDYRVLICQPCRDDLNVKQSCPVEDIERVERR